MVEATIGDEVDRGQSGETAYQVELSEEVSVVIDDEVVPITATMDNVLVVDVDIGIEDMAAMVVGEEGVEDMSDEEIEQVAQMAAQGGPTEVDTVIIAASNADGDAGPLLYEYEGDGSIEDAVAAFLETL